MSERLNECNERVSAMVDGQLSGDEFAHTVNFLVDTPEARHSWDTYHLVGEAMRSAGAPMCAHDPDFVARLRLKLADESPKSIAINSVSEQAKGLNSKKMAASNNNWWKRVAGLASIAVMGMLTWQGVVLLGPGVDRQSDAPLAQLSTPPSQVAVLVTADGASALMIRDPQLDALLAAHRQMGGATALQMPSGFLRNATFDEGKR
ncbi:sigma-E factor negative regulatory protein [Rhodoferax sp.]|uniref:sigma-E factor negative regulatory protein n=1 Tax=Rhodoferax sp. TaxID=50421 RepID=UPI0028485CCE|nr:sigma-E factor negative regulatory protein [Rhodoferax sp.]MDR3370550.1 sigma-E factor negative regulatory protein [Rhodoferax sp.]